MTESKLVPLKVDMCEDDYYLEFCSQMQPKINFLLTLHISCTYHWNYTAKNFMWP